MSGKEALVAKEALRVSLAQEAAKLPVLVGNRDEILTAARERTAKETKRHAAELQAIAALKGAALARGGDLAAATKADQRLLAEFVDRDVLKAEQDAGYEVRRIRLELARALGDAGSVRRAIENVGARYDKVTIARENERLANFEAEAELIAEDLTKAEAKHAPLAEELLRLHDEVRRV